MRTQFLALSLLTGLSVASVSAFAEPPVQAGETLESLSKAKVTTTVNGQPGSLKELLSSGQIKLVNDTTATAAPAPAPSTAPVIEPEGHAAAPVDPAAAQPTQAPEANVEAPQTEAPDAN